MNQITGNALHIKDDDDENNSNVESLAEANFMRYVERFSNIETERDNLLDDRKSLMKEIESDGFNPKAFRQIMREIKRDRSELMEENAAIAMYRKIVSLPQ